MDADLPNEDTDETPRPLWRRALLEWIAPLFGVVVVVQLVGMLRAPSLPDQAPGFTLPDLDGKPVSLADFRGQTVVLNFWATWCGPCRIEAPGFDTFATNNPDIPVIGVTADGPAGKVRKTASDLELHYPLLLADSQTLAAYGVTTFPTTVIVGPDGKVQAAHTGLLFRPQLWWLTR